MQELLLSIIINNSTKKANELEIDFIDSVFLVFAFGIIQWIGIAAKRQTTANHLTASFWDYPYLFIRIIWWWVNQICIRISLIGVHTVQWLRLNLWDFHFPRLGTITMAAIIRREEKEELQHILRTKWGRGGGGGKREIKRNIQSPQLNVCLDLSAVGYS